MTPSFTYSGIGDEAGSAVTDQIAALRQLGWTRLEARNLPGGNWHNVPEAEFEAALAKVADAGIAIDCFSSEVANWARDPLNDEEWAMCLAMLERALQRMAKAGTRKLRGMSFKWQLERPPFDPEVEQAVFAKVRELVKRCAAAGVTYLHENCMNYGGQSLEHTLRLIDAVNMPDLQLVFDTGNPVFAADRRYPDGRRQNALEFYRAVRPWVKHVHIKDGVWNAATQSPEFCYPGEGEGCVKEILADLFRDGYDGVLCIEPHLVRVYHDDSAKSAMSGLESFVEYGRRLMKLAASSDY